MKKEYAFLISVLMTPLWVCVAAGVLVAGLMVGAIAGAIGVSGDFITTLVDYTYKPVWDAAEKYEDKRHDNL